MKYVGVDYGTKRIGVAVSDESATLAFPLGIVESGHKAFQEICDIARENGAEVVVIGESRNYQGELNPVMEQVEKFKTALEVEGFTVVYEPEYMSSVAAARQFAPEEKSRKANPNQELLDASAAAILLQSFLDKMKQRPDVE